MLFTSSFEISGVKSQGKAQVSEKICELEKYGKPGEKKDIIKSFKEKWLGNLFYLEKLFLIKDRIPVLFK